MRNVIRLCHARITVLSHTRRFLGFIGEILLLGVRFPLRDLFHALLMETCSSNLSASYCCFFHKLANL